MNTIRFAIAIFAATVLVGCAGQATIKSESLSAGQPSIRSLLIIEHLDQYIGRKHADSINNGFIAGLNSRGITAHTSSPLNRTPEESRARIDELVMSTGVKHILVIECVGYKINMASVYTELDLELTLIDVRSRKPVWRGSMKWNPSSRITPSAEQAAVFVNSVMGALEKDKIVPILRQSPDA